MAPEAQAAACALCGEPANNKCSACKSDTSSRQYCGKACQVKDWPTHKKVCKDAQNANLEKKLARVAEMIQQAYYDFRENTWDTSIIKIEDRDDGLVIYDGDALKKKKYFIEFPQHLIANDRTKKAVLCAWVCNEPMAWMHDTLVGLLEGLNVKSEEVSVTLGAIHRKIIVHTAHGSIDENWPKFMHDVIRVTSVKTKMQWCIDISGAQYGICQAFWGWEEYAKRFFTTTKYVQAIGKNKSRLEKLAKIPGNPYLSYGLVGLVAEHLNEAVHKWRVDSGLSLAGLIDLDDEKYAQASSELQQIMDVAVRTHVRTQEYKAEFKAAQSYERRYPGRSSDICTSVTRSFYA